MSRGNFLWFDFLLNCCPQPQLHWVCLSLCANPCEWHFWFSWHKNQCPVIPWHCTRASLEKLGWGGWTTLGCSLSHREQQFHPCCFWTGFPFHCSTCRQSRSCWCHTQLLQHFFLILSHVNNVLFSSEGKWQHVENERCCAARMDQGFQVFGSYCPFCQTSVCVTYVLNKFLLSFYNPWGRNAAGF